MRKFALAIPVALAALIATAAFWPSPSLAQGDPPGQLTAVDKDNRPAGLCPLKHTSVTANISGFGCRVNVVQIFSNPSKTPIEAIYTFPLAADAAVDSMRIQVGDRIIQGSIKRREEARRIYDAARNAGQSAALLDQERPNIFTQSVANIMPGKEIRVEISYVQILKFEKGQFEFNFPMVVGPRFLGNATDPGKIRPPITPEGTRTGANIDLTVNLDAGAPIVAVHSTLHKINEERISNSAERITLAKANEIPNRDFILKYQTATDSVQSAFVTNYDGKRGGFFSLVLLPPKAPRTEQITPREMIFVMDQSGSQGGMPIEKSKELTLKLISTLRPHDTFNVFGFNNTVHALFPEPVRPTETTIEQARKFVNAMEANGGTQLLEGLNAALRPARDPKRLRMVVFNTDGYVGDEPQILDTIVKHRNETRIFTFGIGNSVNRFLIDQMSLEGRGDSEVVTLADSADAAVDRFLQRTRSPVLTDVTASFSGIELGDVLPAHIPDVFSETPIVIQGRYENPGQGTLVLHGLAGTTPWTKTINLRFSSESGNPAIQSLWARAKVDELQSSSYLNMVDRDPTDKVTRQITDLALEFGIMTQYTSFVAVEPRVVNIGGKMHTVQVPIEMADGVSYAGVGESQTFALAKSATAASPARGGFGGGGGAPASLGIQIADRAEMAQAPLSGERLSAKNFETKVAKKLKAAKGTVAVMVWLTDVDPKTLAALKKAGLTIDSTDKALKIAFGSLDASKLRALAQIGQVQSIEEVE